MEASKPRYSATEFAERGQTLYQDKVGPRISDADAGKFAAIDIETGAYEIDSDDYEATERLLRRLPAAQIWLARVGDRATYRIGGHQSRQRSYTQRSGCGFSTGICEVQNGDRAKA